VIFSPRQNAQSGSRNLYPLGEHGGNVLATRATEQQYAACRAEQQGGVSSLARAIVLSAIAKKHGKGRNRSRPAGTSDIPVSRRSRSHRRTDGQQRPAHLRRGVAGIHRLLAHRGTLAKARVIIVCAGMEGALAQRSGDWWIPVTPSHQP